MALTAITNIDSDLRQRQLLAAFQQTLYRNANLARLGNRAHEASIRQGNAVTIPQDESAYAVTDAAASGSVASVTYPTGTDFAGDGVVLDFERTFVATPKRLTERQARSITPAALVQMADQMTKAAVNTIQTRIATILRGTTLGNVDQDLSSTTANEAQTLVVGTATNYLQDNGSIAADADSDLIFTGA